MNLHKLQTKIILPKSPGDFQGALTTKPYIMQRFLLGIGVLNLLGIIILSVFFFNANNQKVVYVDSGQLTNNFKGMLDARAVYQKKATAWKANIDTLASEVQQQIFKYEKESPKMTVKERQLSQELTDSCKTKAVYGLPASDEYTSPAGRC